MKKIISLPRLSDNMKNGTLTALCKGPGEAFSAGEVLFEVETDKVVCGIEATEDGVVTRALAQDGDVLPVGAEIVEVETKA